MPRITVSPGISTGILGMRAGDGYGKRGDVSEAADHAAEVLLARFGRDIEKRGNSDGRSTGAFHNRTDWDSWYGITISLTDNEELRWSAMFACLPGSSLEGVPASWVYGGPPYAPYEYQNVYAPHFDTLNGALEWLVEHGVDLCPALQGGEALDPEER